MIYTQKIHTDLQINTLEDLAKLKPFLEDGTLKVNKSQIARELGKDRRTVDKYLKGDISKDKFIRQLSAATEIYLTE